MDGVNGAIGNCKSGATTITMVVVHPTVGNARSGAATLTIVVIHRVISISKSGVTTGKIFYVCWSHDDANSRHWIDME